MNKKNLGKLKESIEYLERLLELSSSNQIAIRNIVANYTDYGTFLKREGKIKESELCYKKALSFDSGFADAWYNLGIIYTDINKTLESIICYETAIRFNPSLIEAYNNLGVIFKESGNNSKAIKYYNIALKINPHFINALNNLSVIYIKIGEIEKAYKIIKRVLKLNPSLPETYNNLGIIYRDEGRISDALLCFNKCLEISPNFENAGQNRLLIMNSLLNLNSYQLFIESCNWGDSFSKLYIKYTNWENDKIKDKKLRVGYISGDFYSHSVSYFIEAPLAFHDQKNFIIFCYSNLKKGDDKTLLLKKYVKNWRDIYGISAMNVCKIISKDKIDILVDLSGHTSGNRLDVMAIKPAPISVTWIGYPNTIGLDSIDYKLTDSFADDLNDKQKYLEKLIRIPSPYHFLCYTPPLNIPDVSPFPVLNSHFITFGSFNNLSKVNASVIKVWSQILLKVPYSRLILKCRAFSSEYVRNKVLNKILNKFLLSSIKPTRIELIPFYYKIFDHLFSYSNIDICLDTFPYAGTTTTCEAMLMGLPIVTIRGETHVSNVGVSLLTATDNFDLIGSTVDEYMNIAVNTAYELLEKVKEGDTKYLYGKRQNQRDKLIKSKLCDGKGFTKALEKVYRGIWAEWSNI